MLSENIILNNLAVFIMSNHVIAISIALAKILVKFGLKSLSSVWKSLIETHKDNFITRILD